MNKTRATRGAAFIIIVHGETFRCIGILQLIAND